MEEKQQEEEKGVQQEDNDGDNDNCDVVRAGSLSVSASVPYSSPSLHQSVCLPACLAWSGLAGPIMVWESVVVRRLAWREDLSLLDGFLISRKGARVIQTSLMFWHPQANGLVTLRLPAVYQCVCYVCVGDCRFLEPGETSLQRSIHNCQSWRSTDHIYGCNDSNGHQTSRASPGPPTGQISS